jgi:uncharacterized protein YbjT (DUF2867 family)
MRSKGLEMAGKHVVTGAFGYTGQYITRRLLSEGGSVKTLTGHPNASSDLAGRIEVAPFNFDHPDLLSKSLEDADTVFNTYWVRFSYRDVTYEKAVANTRVLIDAARKAGVRRFVQVSITNPSEDSPLPYFRGKGQIEKALIESGLSYAIVRPTVAFGLEDVLINNIAWLLRTFPMFAVPGSGEYRLQPIFVEDLATVAVEAAKSPENLVLDAVGPEVYTFNELVQAIKKAIGGRAMMLHMNPRFAWMLSKIVGIITRDVTLTDDEVTGLMADLLISKEPPTGHTRLSEWLNQNADKVGARYASELARHYR